MKSVIKKIKTNIYPIFQVIVIILSLFIPTIFNLESIYDVELKNPTNFFEVIFQFCLYKGNVLLGIALFIVVFYLFRTHNKDTVFNAGDTYKDFPYIWYWFCSKILGYKKCSLVLVPIYMQFKLVISDTFNDYIYGEIQNIDSKDDVINIQYFNFRDDGCDELNSMVADTYSLNKNQLPNSKKSLPTILIRRNNKNDYNRYDSSNLVKNVVNEVRNLPLCIKKVNIFATTNPLNSKNIACNAFKLGDRSNFDIITVYQQQNNDLRTFKDNGKVIYKR